MNDQITQWLGHPDMPTLAAVIHKDIIHVRVISGLTATLVNAPDYIIATIPALQKTKTLSRTKMALLAFITLINEATPPMALTNLGAIAWCCHTVLKLSQPQGTWAHVQDRVHLFYPDSTRLPIKVTFNRNRNQWQAHHVVASTLSPWQSPIPQDRQPQNYSLQDLCALVETFPYPRNNNPVLVFWPKPPP